MAVTTFPMGKDAKLYQGAADAEVADMTVNGNVKDVTVTLDATEADTTYRANRGWKSTSAARKECTIEFETAWKPGDTHFDALQAAFVDGSQVGLAPLHCDRDTVGSQGPHGDFSVTGFTRNEPIEGGVTVSVTAKMTVFKAWYKKAAA